VTLFHALGPFAAQVGVVAAPGMVLMKPTSIAHSGTSATLGANGQVTFTAVTSLSLNGVFTADFDNYVISIRHNNSSSPADSDSIQARLRASGSDASGGDYTRQTLSANSTTVSAARTTSLTSAVVAVTGNAQRNGDTIAIYGPYLAQPTAFRSVNVADTSSARILDNACTHSLSTSYDGITFIPEIYSITGAVAVYGIRS
jgi:hypothetical protein